MKWILLLIGLSYSALTLSKNLPCQQATRLYEKVRAEQRNGYAAKKGNLLNCLKREANRARGKYCKTRQGQKVKPAPVTKHIRAKCKTSTR